MGLRVRVTQVAQDSVGISDVELAGYSKRGMALLVI
jgi:hypothetical protein